MTIEEAIEEIRDLWDYSVIKCWPRSEQDALKYALDFMEKHKDDNDDYF